MALYEGIALIQEKQAVVLDLGTDYTKFGFTGEAAPRCIVRSEFWNAASRAFKRVFDYDTPEELYDNLVNMLHLLYFRRKLIYKSMMVTLPESVFGSCPFTHDQEQLLVLMAALFYCRSRHVLVNPKERKVVVVESLLTPTLFRETLAKVLFTHYEVSGVVWADSARLCALTLGAPVVLVCSIGAKEAEVTAGTARLGFRTHLWCPDVGSVVHNCVVLQTLEAQPVAARAVHAELARLLDEDNGAQLDLPDHVIEDIK
ncbi:Actin-related protein 10, partial [Operophtera brumata]